MGLKQAHYVDWLRLRFPKAVRPIHIRESAKFDSVFIDVNCILHPAVRSSKNESEFVKRLYMTLDKLLRQCIPVRCCYLSIDGAAPFAKLALQKDRRRTKNGRMSTLQITPGCPFMARVEKYLDYYAVRYLQQRQGRNISPDLKFIIDHGNNPGEGECKIVENIIQQKENIRGRPCALISLDSDTILQALALAIPNMYVIRKEKSKQHVAISIDHLMMAISEQFPGGALRARLDFCALCMFRGNDYLRGMPIGIDRLWNSYIFTKTKDNTLTAKNSWLLDVNYKCFDLVFLRQLMKNAIRMPKTPNRMPNKLTSLLKEATTNLAAATTAAGETSDDSDDESDMTTDASDIDSDTDSDTECDTSVVEDDEDEETPQDPYGGGPTPMFSVERYLQAVLWNIEFYSSGVCPDISFIYDFRIAPKPASIVAYIDSIESKKSLAALQPSAASKYLGVPTSKADYPSPLVTPLDSGAKYLPASVAGIHSTVDDKGSILMPGRIEEIDKQVRQLIAEYSNSKDPVGRREASLLQNLYRTQPPHIWTRTRPGNIRRSARPLPSAPTEVMAFKHEAVGVTAPANQDVATLETKTEPTLEAELASTSISDPSQQRSRHFEPLKEQADIVCMRTRPPPSSLKLKDIKQLKRYPWMDGTQTFNNNPTWPFLTAYGGPRGVVRVKQQPPPAILPASLASSAVVGTSEGASVSATGSGHSSDSVANAKEKKSKRSKRKEKFTKPSAVSSEASLPQTQKQETNEANVQVDHNAHVSDNLPASNIPLEAQPEEKKVDLLAMLQASMARFQEQESVSQPNNIPPSPAAPTVKASPPAVKKPLPQIKASSELKAFMPLSVQSLAAQRAKGSKQPKA
ncbi:hypothetical protein BGW41_003455 [Actinomortierella wolfii]|nr:hypothetical protein BGW41_003455 [Actinomortierella wolfii]